MKGLRFKNIIFILLGAAIFAFGLVNFNMQNNLAEGGFTGITLLLFFLFNLSFILRTTLLWFDKLVTFILVFNGRTLQAAESFW